MISSAVFAMSCRVACSSPVIVFLLLGLTLERCFCYSCDYRAHLFVETLLLAPTRSTPERPQEIFHVWTSFLLGESEIEVSVANCLASLQLLSKLFEFLSGGSNVREESVFKFLVGD